MFLKPELRHVDVNVDDVPVRDDPVCDVVHGQLQYGAQRTNQRLHLSDHTCRRQNIIRKSVYALAAAKLGSIPPPLKSGDKHLFLRTCAVKVTLNLTFSIPNWVTFIHKLDKYLKGFFLYGSLLPPRNKKLWLISQLLLFFYYFTSHNSELWEK